MAVDIDPRDGPEGEHPFVLEVIKLFREIRDKVYTILPEDCLHKRRNTLAFQMIVLANPKLIDKQWTSRSDICSLCDIEICPWYNRASYRPLRFLKSIILGKIFGSPMKSFFKKLKKIK